METGITGWMLAVYFIALAEPMPKSQLFWVGTEMRLATGLLSFLASSACSSAAASPWPPPLEAAVSAGGEGEGAIEAKFSLRGGRGGAESADERSSDEVLFVGHSHNGLLICWVTNLSVSRVKSRAASGETARVFHNRIISLA